jgi:hypothetical protein
MATRSHVVERVSMLKVELYCLLDVVAVGTCKKSFNELASFFSLAERLQLPGSRKRQVMR